MVMGKIIRLKPDQLLTQSNLRAFVGASAVCWLGSYPKNNYR